MKDIFYLGPAPAEEECAQTVDNDFAARNKAECLQYITAIKRVCGEPPEEATLRIKSESHDFGTYREVVVEFNHECPEAVAYAMKCDEHAPTTWEQAGMCAPECKGRCR